MNTPIRLIAVFAAFIILCSPLFCEEIWAVTTTTQTPDMTYGEEDDPQGNGTPLTLEAASIHSGQKQVPCLPLIQLDFNKNVVNLSVSQNNIQCFHLTDADGNTRPIKLIFPDDQLQRDVKRNIFIQPSDSLSPNTDYTLYIDSTLMAKNGTYIDQAYVIPFTTGTDTQGESNALLESLGDLLVIYESNLPPGEYSRPGSSPEEPSSGEEQALSETAPIQTSGSGNHTAVTAEKLDKISLFITISAICFALILTLLLFLRKRKKEQKI